MFDFAWSEIAVIAVAALVLIGPKDMPVALKGITDMIKKARRMAGEFQTHVDEMMREADLTEVRDQFNEIRNFNIRGAVERAVDNDGTIRRALNTNPMHPDPVSPATATATTPGATGAAGSAHAAAPLHTASVPGVTPPPVVLRPGASPFDITMPTIAAAPPAAAAPAFVPPHPT